MKTQPKAFIRKPSTAEATAERLSTKNTPHNTKSIEIPKETPNTPGSIVEPTDLRIVIHPSLTFSFNKHQALLRVIRATERRGRSVTGHAPVEDRERSGLETLANILPRLPDCDTYYFEDLFNMTLNFVKASLVWRRTMRCETQIWLALRLDPVVCRRCLWAQGAMMLCLPQRLPMTSCIPRKAKSNTEATRITFETIPLRCSGATRLEFRSQRSVMARKGRNRAPIAA